MFTTVNTLQKLKGMFCHTPHPPLTFSPYAWVKINCYIQLIGDLEITGLGKIEDNIITDIMIFEQEVRSAFVECPVDAITNFLIDNPTTAHLWRLDWHSHVNMATSPSVTDIKNYEVMQQLRMGEPFPFLIINKRQQMTCKEYVADGMTPHIDIHIPTDTISTTMLTQIYNEAKADVERLCTQYVAPPAAVTTTNQTWSYGYQEAYGKKKDSNYQNPWYKPAPTYAEENIQMAWAEKKVALCKICEGELSTEEEEQGYCDSCLIKLYTQNNE
jgi:hypothetical protein